MANKRINIAELEFDSIKNNLKEYLRGQSQFTDYDFEGSNMSIILDILSYNTHYNALYTNMAINELFLDSASRRSSVVSLAKSLGYIPRSSKCATTTIDFTVTGVTEDPLPNILLFPKNSTFQGIKDGIRYTFYTREDYSASLSGSSYTFNNIPIYEGDILTNSFEFTSQNSFPIPNLNIDTNTLIVRVQPNPSSTLTTTYVFASELSELTDQSEVFFLKELDGYYYIYFGDDVLGKRPPVGSIINIEYFVCSGEGPNGIRYISYTGDTISGGIVADQNFSMQTAVYGGREPEDIDSIRFNAPNSYNAQRRAVTELDYETILLSKVPALESVVVWGGEKNIPPQYGKVFICANTTSGEPLTYSEQKDIIENVLQPSKILTIIPEFVNPTYLNIELDVVAYYDEKISQNSASTIRSLIIDALLDYNDVELQKFSKILRSSQISRLIENVDSSIVSSVPRIKMRRSFTPIFKKVENYQIIIGNPFSPGTVLSTNFYRSNSTSTYYFKDDSEQNLILYEVTSGITKSLGVFGSVDYQNGIIKTNPLSISRAPNNIITFSITPSSADISGNLNQILTLDTSLLRVAVIPDKTVHDSGSFVFTSNRI